ncbi:unnamed protein product [Ectocarpus sp. 12 AP-2014]
MGVLDPTTSDEDLSQGAKVDFPLWMARPLASKGMTETLTLPSRAHPQVPRAVGGRPRRRQP